MEHLICDYNRKIYLQNIQKSNKKIKHFSYLSIFSYLLQLYRN